MEFHGWASESPIWGGPTSKSVECSRLGVSRHLAGPKKPSPNQFSPPGL